MPGNRDPYGGLDSHDQYLTVTEVAGMLRVSAAMVYGLIERGMLPAMKVGRGAGGTWRIDRTDVTTLIHTLKTQQKEATTP